MERFFPTTLVELIAGVGVQGAIGLAVVSIRTRMRAHVNEMFAILSAT